MGDGLRAKETLGGTHSTKVALHVDVSMGEYTGLRVSVFMNDALNAGT